MKLQPAIYILIIAVAALSRLFPIAPNFTPIGALALFAGASFTQRYMAYLIPLAAMMLSDLVLGYGIHRDMLSVYVAFMLTVLMGRYLMRPDQKPKVSSIAALSVLSSTLFYVLTNFSVWVTSGRYPHTAAGLMESYIMGIPFFGNTLASGLFFAALMFGAARLADQTILKPATA